MNILARNESTLDRVIRIVAGLGLISLMFFGPRTPWGALGFILLITGLVGTCPLYRVFGLSTCPRDGTC